MTENLSDYIDKEPKKWTFLGALWKYKKEIAVAVAVTAGVLLVVGATQGFGVLAVGVAALPQISSGATVAYTFGTIFLAGALGYGTKRALKSNSEKQNTRSLFKIPPLFKEFIDETLYKVSSGRS